MILETPLEAEFVPSGDDLGAVKQRPEQAMPCCPSGAVTQAELG